jgi:hypothetical protein
LYKLARAGYTYIEVGVPHLPRTAGKATGAKPMVILRALGEMIYFANKWRQDELQEDRDAYNVQIRISQTQVAP